MTNENECYRISVFGEQYTLQSDEPAQRVLEAATLVDSLMKEIAAQHVTLESKKVAVLAAIRIASMFLEKEAACAKEFTVKQEIIDLLEQELHI